MNPEQLEKRQALLCDELGKVRAQMGTLSNKILTAPVEGISKLVSERVDLQNQAAALQGSLSDIRQRMMDAQKQATKQAEDSERRRKETIFAYLKTNPPACPNCGAPSKVIEKPQQPEGRSADFWIVPSPKVWKVSFECSEPPLKCGVRNTIWPDEQYEVVDSKVTAQPPKKEEGFRERKRKRGVRQ